jgi:RND family efflux transporter MFP subunit
MRLRPWLPLLIAVVAAAAWLAGRATPQARTDRAEPAALEVTGRTQCVPGKIASIAPVPLHPVEKVLVVPGERVKKDQKLIEIDADEQKAVVRNKKAQLEVATACLAEAKRYLEAVEKANAVLPEQKHHEARLGVFKCEADERAARASLEAEEAELEHYTLTAPFDGVVAWLEVTPGLVSRPGTTLWGEIMDLAEVDVRCDLTPAQAERVAAGQKAEVRTGSGKGPPLAGRVASVGIAADRSSGLVPVLVRVANPEGRLRCYVPAQVRFTEATAGDGK